MLSKLLRIQKGSDTVATSTPKKERAMPPPISIDIDEDAENQLLYPERINKQQIENIEDRIENISSNLSSLGVNQSLSNSIASPSTTLTNPVDQNSTKRARSNNGSMNNSANPPKKLRTLLAAPTMAEVVKTLNDGHVIDIQAAEGTLTMEQSKQLQEKLIEALFAEDDISNLNFGEPPSFDGTKLRLTCCNTITKEWVEQTVPTLTGLWDNAQLSLTIVGPPPDLYRASFQMPHPTYDPPTLFSIINDQNKAIDTKFWKYISRTKVDRGTQTWSIGVDESSIAALKEIGFRPHVGLGSIKMSVTKQRLQQ